MDIDSLRGDLKQYNQEHLLAGWSDLLEDQQRQLYADLRSINYEQVTGFFKRCSADLHAPVETVAKDDDSLEPLPSDAIGRSVQCSDDVLEGYREAGLRKVADSKVAVLLLAGGQGTRLGVPYPKGMYDVGLPSHKSLYHIQGEKLHKLTQLAKQLTGTMGSVPWYIMASEHTKESTRKYFQEHNYFGVNSDDVIFFEQHMLPCFTFDGKIILETPSKVARAPDGNGGLYRALDSNGILDDMEQRGVEYIHVYCVDNILVKMADPVFLGFCLEKKAQCAAKAVEKLVPTEAVGVICKRSGLYQVTEYSEISLTTAEKRDTDGRLMYNAANICNHIFNFNFLKNVVRSREHDLRHHIAKKKIPFYDFNEKQQIKPTTPNGIKMEKFIFDVFEFTNEFAVWEVLREDEFSPLKNADTQPKDTPTTARHSIYDLHKRYVLHAGGKFIRSDGTAISHIPSLTDRNGNNTDTTNGTSNHGDSDDVSIVCEISPLLSYAGEGLQHLVKGKSFIPPLYLKSGEEDGKEMMEVAGN